MYKHAREEEDGSVTEVKESINLVFGELINSNEWIHVCLDINEAFLQQGNIFMQRHNIFMQRHKNHGLIACGSLSI